MPLLRVDDVDINYVIDDFTNPWLDKKTVKTVLLHHPYIKGLEQYTQWIPTLARKYRVVRFDSRGVGESSAPPEPFQMTVAQLVDDTLGVMDQLGLDKVHFGGVQSGGVVGQIIAATHPERIISLTLCNSPHKFSDRLVDIMSLGNGDIGEAIKRLGFWEWRARGSGSGGFDMRKADPRMIQWQNERHAKVPMHIQASQIEDTAKGDTAELLKDIKCPTLLINGDRSVIVPPEMQNFMLQQIPNARNLVLPDISDGFHLMMADQCARAMLDFIEEVDSSK